MRRKEATPLCRENAAGTTFLDPLCRANPAVSLPLFRCPSPHSSSFSTNPPFSPRFRGTWSFYRDLGEVDALQRFSQSASLIVRVHRTYIGAIFLSLLFPGISSRESPISASKPSAIARFAKNARPNCDQLLRFQYIASCVICHY